MPRQRLDRPQADRAVLADPQVLRDRGGGMTALRRDVGALGLRALQLGLRQRLLASGELGLPLGGDLVVLSMRGVELPALAVGVTQPFERGDRRQGLTRRRSLGLRLVRPLAFGLPPGHQRSGVGDPPGQARHPGGHAHLGQQVNLGPNGLPQRPGLPSPVRVLPHRADQLGNLAGQLGKPGHPGLRGGLGLLAGTPGQRGESVLSPRRQLARELRPLPRLLPDGLVHAERRAVRRAGSAGQRPARAGTRRTALAAAAPTG